jgi:hypothetical protein
VPLSGDFTTMPLADLLQWLGDSRRSGILAVALDFEERYLRFEKGKIAAYGSDDPMARDLGRLCLGAGLVDEPTLMKAVATQATSQMPLSDVLVAEGAMSADALDEMVRRHVEETVLGLFLWPEGRFSLSDSPTPEAEAWMPPEYELAEPLDTRGILLEGMRRLDEWKRIVKVLPSDDALVVALGPAADLPILEEIAAHPEPPTLGELLEWKGDSRYAVCEQLFAAVRRGLLAFDTRRVERGFHHGGHRGARGSTTVEHLVRAARSLEQEGQHEEASTLLRSAVAMDPFRAELRELLRSSLDAQLRLLYEVLPVERVPRLMVPSQRAEQLQLSPRERKVLAHINGRWDVQALGITSGLGELETLRALRRLIHAGVVELN